MFNALAVVAETFETTPQDMLAATDLLIYGTTRATNAIVTKQTARTAFLTTTACKHMQHIRFADVRTRTKRKIV